MKRTLLFLFCALMSTQMFSETLFGYLFPTLAYLERTSCHYMEGNEQNRTLNRLSFEDNMFEIDGNYYIEYNDMWLREDKEGKIFVYSEPAKKDLVLYDFTLEVGDTLTTLNIDIVPMTEGDPILPGVKPVVVDYPIHLDEYVSFPIDTLIVTDVSMVMMCDSNQYKKWTFSNGMEYMEYIGNLGADFFAIIRNPWEELPTCCVEEDLVCASIYDRLVYLMDDEKRDLLNIDCPCTSWSNKWQWRTNTWNVLQFDGMAFEQTAQTWQYELAHDTIIGGKEYTAVTRHWTAYDESAAEYVAAVRFTENKKAFIYYDNAEYLLYDFGYHEFGDTLEVFSGINNYEHFKTYKCVITNNYSTAGGIAEDTYVMDIIHPITGDTIPSALVWQEFVGSYSGFLHGGLLVPGNSNYQLLCAYKDNVLAYSVDNDAFTDNDTFIEYGCEYNAEQKPKYLFPTLWGLQRTEVEFHTDGAAAPSLVSFNEYTPTLVNGKWYLYDGRNYLREENNQVLLYSPEFEIYEDVVLYDWALEIGDTLPFTIRPFDDDKSRGAVFRVTDVSTITLLDGKEYKKWTLACGIEYIEGIGAINGEGFGNYFCIQHTAHPATYIDTRLVCASRNGQLLYQMDDAEMERLGTECLCEVETSYKSQWCDTWNILVKTGSVHPPVEETYRYQLAQDTVIGNYTYIAVVRKAINDALGAPRYVAAVRFTDDRKVYVYYDNAEYLLYDFNVQQGDELEVFAGINNYTSEIKTYKCTVTGIEQYACVGCPATITLEVHNHPDDFREFYRQTQWIEGVGDFNGFLNGINHYIEMDGGGSEYLLCAHRGDELKYTGPLYEEYGCEYNAGPFNEKLLGTWRVVGGNEIISISDSIIVFIGLTQKYTASATQLTVERLWIPEEESYRWANCNYTLSNDTLWIDNFMPLLVATYPPTFGPITLVKVKYEDLFPTLWGLQRTSCTKTIGEDEEGTVWGSRSYLMQETQTTTIDGKQYIVFGDEYDRFALREENNKILVYSSILKKDLVLYDFTLEVGDSLPALYYELRAHDTMHQWLYIGDIVDYNKDDDGTILPAETFVVTDISTITLLDGKDYKKWTFDNGMEYVEGIGSFGTSYAWNDFYQLIANGPLYSDVHSQHLVCVSKNGKLLYQMDDAEMERLGAECLCEVETSYKSQWCNQWNILEYNVSGMGIPEETWRYYLAEDITINGTTYTTVNRYWTADKTKCESVATIRFTENQKVYALLGDTEYLVYDFSVQVGDTIETIVGVNYGTMLQQLLVHQIDIAMPTGPKTITLYPICKMEDGECDDCDEDGHYLWECCPIEWIEGIGSTDGFLMGYPPCGHVGGIGHKLLCAYKDDELQYINELYQDDYGCEYNAGQNPEDLFPTLWGLQRTSCDEWYDGCGENKSYLFAPKEVKEINGKLYLKCGGVFLREEDSKVLIYSFPYEKDFVLYDYTLEVGGTLQNLGIDIYSFPELEYAAVVDYIAYEDYDVETDEFIIKKEPLGSKRVQEVSTITLLDGKEYKRWLFGNDWENGDYYIEGIGNVGGSFGGDYIDIANPYGTPIPTCYLGERLVCASKNNKLLYQMDYAEMERLGAECLCDYDRGPRKDNAKNGKIGGRPTPTQWNMLEVETKEMDGTPTILRAETFSYTLENDSIVTKGKTYYQLARQSTKDTAITKSFVGALHFGEDEDNRVYFLRDGVEYVLYDFTAEPGDTIEIFAGINNYPQYTTYTHVVTGKDTLENGACRMMLEVVFPDETTTTTNAEKVWLAGLGSIDGIVHNTATRTSDAHAAPARSAYSSDTQTSVMLCAWREDSCLYTTNHPEYDTFGCVYNQDPTAVENLTSPSSYQKILHEGKLLILHNGKIYNVLGVSAK